ncbi:ankyrin repeat domain-containing protein [Streptomyces sp. NPDC018610]|uniref:ankyrin repeat domain-containing protein n=1 Tax=Streptomyces sp. NPDC018610 TaxID=3365049 RepID=UPI0037A38C3F
MRVWLVKNGHLRHKAVEGGDYEAVAMLLDSGADPDELCFGHTLLTQAVDVAGDSHWQTGYPLNATAAAILLAYGANPELPTADGETPLRMARYYEHEPAQRLIQRFLHS